MLITNAKPCQNSRYGGMESSQMPFPGSWIYAKYLFKNKFKALNTLLNSAEYTKVYNKEKSIFVSLLGYSNMWTLCNHHEPSWSVRSNWEGRDILAVSSLPFPPLLTRPMTSDALVERFVDDVDKRTDPCWVSTLADQILMTIANAVR